MIRFKAIFALLLRSIRADSRSAWTYAMRIGLVGVVFLSLIGAYMESSYQAAPGLSLFSSVIFINFAFITLGGLSFFANCITEEKEEMTLGLLRMTNLNPVSILLGKSGSRLLGAFLLLLVQFPFTLLAITLGGVSIDQIVAAYCTLGAYIFMLCNLAMLFSTIVLRSREASLLTFLALLVFFVGPWIGSMLIATGTIAMGGSIATGFNAAFTWVVDASPITRLVEIQVTGFADEPIGYQVICNVAAGAAFFALAWLLFNRFNREQRSAAPGRGSTSSRKTLARRRRSGRRAWDAALVWKDFHFITGGKRGQIVRVMIYTAAVVLVVRLAGYPYASLDTEEVGVIMVIIGLCGFFAELALSAGSIFRQEIRWRTWSGISMLPKSVSRLAYEKIAGVLISTIPSLLCCLIGYWLVFDKVNDVLVKGFVEDIWGWVTLLIALLFLHLIAFLSLWLKWGALVASVGIFIIGGMLLQFLIAMLFFIGSMPMPDENILAALVIMASLSLTVLLHIATGFRLRTLAAQ